MMQIIYGQIPSKSNNYRVKVVKGRPIMFKSSKVTAYEKSFALQCTRYKNKNIDREFEIVVNVYFKTKSSDLDNAFKILMDSLEMCKAIKNDRLCVGIIAKKFIDSKNPRIEFKIL